MVGDRQVNDSGREKDHCEGGERLLQGSESLLNGGQGVRLCAALFGSWSRRDRCRAGRHDGRACPRCRVLEGAPRAGL